MYQITVKQNLLAFPLSCIYIISYVIIVISFVYIHKFSLLSTWFSKNFYAVYACILSKHLMGQRTPKRGFKDICYVLRLAVLLSKVIQKTFFIFLLPYFKYNEYSICYVHISFLKAFVKIWQDLK